MCTYHLRTHRAAYYLLLLVFAILFFGCYNSRKAISDTDKALLKFPTETLTHIHELYPCAEKPIVTIRDSADYFIWKNKVDSLNHYYDSLVESFAPQIEYDTLLITDSAKLVQCGLNNGGLKKVIAAKDEKIKQLNRVINNDPTIHDTTKVFLDDSLSHKLVLTQKDEISTLKLSVSDWKGKAHTREWIIWFLLLVIATYIGFRIKKAVTKVPIP